MNINLLIDAIVRQTTVLIAQLATAAGTRATLAHTANQVFMDLVRELKDQGLGNKVIADMFGLSLRTYHNKVARLSESTTERGRSLWEAVLAHIEERGPVSRAAILLRFCRDDVATVKGVLADLVDSGVVYRTGKGDGVTYRAAHPDDYTARGDHEAERVASLVWVAVFRYGPITQAELAEVIPTDRATLEEALRHLLANSRVTVAKEADQTRYACDRCVIPMGDAIGWEAAVFDHYQAMVTAISTKLRSGRTAASPGEWVGGSTYHFDVWQGHPLLDEVVGFLQDTRGRAVDLRRRVETFNDQHPPEEHTAMRVTAYVGQTVVGPEAEEPTG
ncbi:MAG: hypothetical protein JW751_04605 [Polyangiaceae bacterium]|nr:hypothetical protein [Polyangiaceae bacterium]